MDAEEEYFFMGSNEATKWCACIVADTGGFSASIASLRFNWSGSNRMDSAYCFAIASSANNPMAGFIMPK
jgi:hypothetical protein